MISLKQFTLKEKFQKRVNFFKTNFQQTNKKQPDKQFEKYILIIKYIRIYIFIKTKQNKKANTKNNQTNILGF